MFYSQYSSCWFVSRSLQSLWFQWREAKQERQPLEAVALLYKIVINGSSLSVIVQRLLDVSPYEALPREQIRGTSGQARYPRSLKKLRLT